MGADKDRRTVPVTNKIQYLDDYLRWIEWWSAFQTASTRYSNTHRGFSKSGGLQLVQTHKDLFGQQDYCYTTYRRYWVWEFEGYRVWVNNEAGISLEVEPNLDPEEALEAMRDYTGRWPFDPDAIYDAYSERTEEAMQEIQQMITDAGDSHD